MGGEKEAWELSPGGGAGEARVGVSLPGRAWPQLPTLTWSAGCAWLALAPGVGCCSCFMAVIARGPCWRSLPRGHFRLGDRHLAGIACHRLPMLSELAEGKAAAPSARRPVGCPAARAPASGKRCSRRRRGSCAGSWGRSRLRASEAEGREEREERVTVGRRSPTDPARQPQS